MNHNVMQITGGAALPILLSFLGEAFVLMIPWFVTMVSVVLADLAAGIWKSYKLEIPIRLSKACRETMGKLVVYIAFVVMVCCINIAAKEDFNYAKWASMLVILIEGGSILGNMLKPHGINISLNALIKAFISHSALPLTCPDIDSILEKKDLKEIRKEEEAKLNHSKQTTRKPRKVHETPA